ncbi:hypothetical protein RyT2_19200 [Pseudolactococcus yaeyamensis]
MTKNECYIIDFESLDYAKFMFDVVNQTDQENWDYFSSSPNEMARDFLQYGHLSRVIVEKDAVTGEKSAAAYIQVRILKPTAATLLYEDLYHQVGLNFSDLQEATDSRNEHHSIYIDVIAIKKHYQNRLEILKLIPQALKDIFEVNDLHRVSTIFAVGVTDRGRKMCQKMGLYERSEVWRGNDDNRHKRTLFSQETFWFWRNFEKINGNHNENTKSGKFYF